MSRESNWNRLLHRNELAAASNTRVDHQLTNDEAQQLNSVFDLFDSDGDGRIVASEIGTALASLHGQHPTKKELERILVGADVDLNGYVDRAEFARIASKGSQCRLRRYSQQQQQPLTTEKDLARAFRVFDADRDGFIAPAELRSALVRLLPPGEVTDQLVADMIRFADADGDGRVSFAEFASIVCADDVR